jgi:hypothetical protein
MPTIPDTDRVQIHFVSPEEEWAIFDGMAHDSLNLSGEEFLRRWDAGEWKANPDRPGVIQLAFMLPFGRPDAV